MVHSHFRTIRWMLLISPLALGACAHEPTTASTTMSSTTQDEQARAAAQQALQVAQQAQQTANEAKQEADRMYQRGLQK